MSRYRVIDTMNRENEHLLGDDVDRAVGEEFVYLLEEADNE
jgi:hypothetical protein